MPFLKKGRKVIPNFWKGAVSEGTTEMLQELANIGFDLVDGTIDFSKMPERLYGIFEQGVISGLVGGTTAGAFSIKNRAQIKNYLREELAGVVPEKDLNAVVNKLYEDGIDTIAGVVTAELSESESLRNKHGDIYRAMMTAIDEAATQSGAFADEAAALSDKLKSLRRHDLVTVTFYDKDAYITKTGMITDIDFTFQTLTIVKTKIPFQDILRL